MDAPESGRRRAWRRMSALDRAWILRVAQARHPYVTVVMRALTKLGNPSGLTVIGVVMACLGPGWGLTARAYGVGALAAGIAAQSIKRLFARERPNVEIEGFESIAGNPDRFSFPSGHSATAFAAACVLLAHPGAIGVVATVLAVGIASSRVYLGAHYPFDVLFGAVLGGVIGLVARALIL